MHHRLVAPLVGRRYLSPAQHHALRAKICHVSLDNVTHARAQCVTASLSATLHRSARPERKSRGMSDDQSHSVGPVLTTTEAAQWLRLSPSTLRRLAQRGEGPPFVQVAPRCRRYPLDGLTAYIACQTQSEVIR